MGDKKKIVLADAAEEFRQMLADMIGGEADLTVCAQTASGHLSILNNYKALPIHKIHEHGFNSLS